MREYNEREDYSVRIEKRIGRTYSEKLWETCNPGYELHVVSSWKEIPIGAKIWEGYVGHIPSVFLGVSASGMISEKDEPNILYGTCGGVRNHMTPWNVKMMRVIVEV